MMKCNRCFMDSSASDFELVGPLGCNYCNPEFHTSSSSERTQELNAIVSKIKAEGKNKRYDCIVGISGGIDSAYVLKVALDNGLRVLAVHMDNGWNSELAQNNIEGLIQYYGIDYETYVIQWEDYKALMQSFFDADVVDVELLYDNAMYAVNYSLADKYKTRWILCGLNSATEGMRLPQDWTWFKFDKMNIKDIARKNGNARLNSFPSMGIGKLLFYKYIKRVEFFPILDYVDYRKDTALEFLEKHTGYKRYPYKHYESVFTRFFQGYILPNKFGIDKRKTHLSTLYVTNQISYELAESDLKKSPYPDPKALEDDKAYFMKKMGWSVLELENYIARARKEHYDYQNEYKYWNYLLAVKRFLSEIFK